MVEEARPHDHERPQRSLEAELLPSLAGGEAVNAIVYGRAIENYLNDAPVDVGVKLNAGNTTTPIVGEALPVLSIVAYLDHNWTKVWSTSAGYSRVDISNSNGQAASAFKTGQYATVNLRYMPARSIMIGGEFQWAQRQNLSDGWTANDYRFEFSFKYSFSYKLGG